MTLSHAVGLTPFALVAALVLSTNIAIAQASVEEMIPLSASDSVQLFSKICLETQPDFEGGVAVMKSLGFTKEVTENSFQNPETLAIASAGDAVRGSFECSILFRSSSSDEGVFGSLKRLPDLRLGLGTGDFVFRKNGQKRVSFGRVFEDESRKLRMIRMGVGSNAAQFDQ